mmetsp:Transcript_8349/g.14605  ORF Transcript_8349/g.14605 Transcript_8349/m.14605 type:complete len:1073 (-) Transcript_8349:25-3243(-)
MSSLLPPPQRTTSTRSTSSLSAASYSNNGIDPVMEERLSSLLASPSFSVSHYLNLALAPTPVSTTEQDAPTTNNTTVSNSNALSAEAQAEHQLEQRMASLALQLQMRTQSCHDEIGRIGAELQAIVPRCAADVGRLQVGLEGMELDVRGLLAGMDDHRGSNSKRKGDTKKGEVTTVGGADVGAGGSTTDTTKTHGDDPLTTLHSLLNLRTHLTTSRAILSAASSWDETINSIPMLLSTTPPNLVEAVAALSQLEQGARALHGMPEGRMEREAALRKLRTQLEILLKPQLLHALKRMDTRLGPLQQCVGMYGSLGKMEVMREEYVRMRPGEIHSLWFSFNGGLGGNGKGNDGEDKNSDDATNDGLYEGDDSKQELDEDEVEDFDFDEPLDNSPKTPSTTTTPTQQQTTAKQFMEFLPTFYDAVLELLSKERTQSKLVFGPALSPSIVARVLMECFKPIVDSFEKRLGNLCPLGGGGISMGGTEAIAAAYESTIQFLSLAYDQMEPWNMHSESNDSNDSNKLTDPDPTSHDQEMPLQAIIHSTFLLIASPFLPYQRNLAETERHPMMEAASMVAKDVRGVVHLEDAAERLGDLAPFMFPLVEAAMKRFELLNSGYNAPATLSSIDILISNHASELAIAMGTLSTNASSTNNRSGTSSAGGSGGEFDEQHVNCALEILRIAGQFKRNIQSLECSVKDRLRILSNEIMMADSVLEGDGDNALIPEELAPVQIRALLAKAACDPPGNTHVDDGTGIKCPTTVVELQRLAGRPPNNNKSNNDSPPLFPKALDATSRLAKSCLSFVFEVCSAIPERQLHGISALPVWKNEGTSMDDDETSYGILPQSFITHVGEHMLALVQALEPFASDVEALGLAEEVMENVLEVAVQPWKEFVAAAGCSFATMSTKATAGEEKMQLEMLMRGKDLGKYFLDEDAHEDDVMEEDDGMGEHEEEEEEDAKASAAFCNQWLDVVGLAVTGRLLERTMRIPRLGRKGAEHLATDLNYIRNVFTALGVAGHPHALLGYVAQLVTLEDGVLREKIQRRRRMEGVTEEGVMEGALLEVVQRAELRIAYVRSISV